MDKNTIIGLLLIFGLFLGYSFYTSNQSKKNREEQMKAAEATAKAKAAQDSTTIKITEDTIAQSTSDTSVVATSDTIQETAAPVSNSVLGYTGDRQNDFVVKTKKAEYHFARTGGYLKKVVFPDIYKYTPKNEPKQPLVLFDDGSNQLSLSLPVMDNDRSTVSTSDCYFTAEQDTVNITSGKGHLKLYLHPLMAGDSTASNTIDKNAYILFDYTFTADDYMFDYSVSFVNMSPYMQKKKNFTILWNADLYTAEKNIRNERDLTHLCYMDNCDKVGNLAERSTDEQEFTTPLKWVSFKQQFFTSVLISKEKFFDNAELKVNADEQGETNPLLKKMHAGLNITVDNLDNGQYHMSMYVGPNQYKLLKTYQMNLEKQVPLGWGFFLLHWINRFVVIPIFNWLEAYGLSYGIIILILSIFIKIVIMPLAYKTYMSSAKMRVLKPEIEELSAKYPKPEDAMKKQQAQMMLYKKAGISPAAGCLPMLLQMPILIAMYRFFPAAYELRQQPFLWAEDLSAYDSILDLNFSIPFYGDHVSLFTLLMTAATIVYTWLNNKLMSAGNNDQMKVMKIMMYLMPILFLGMFNSFSSALTYYYLLINLITFLQMWIFRISINEEKLRKRMSENMVKPVKKTKWQMRMEELMKQQQQLQKNKK
ncbi:MAG: membrane protein insertase YidC [Bacteroidales bacterium]|nr:membrane protein insertase YidC [Bacteroidales bacterium]